MSPDEADELPEGWCNTTVGDVSQLESGTGFPIEFQGKPGLKYPFYKVGNLADVASGEPLTTSTHTVDEKDVSNLKAKIIPRESILFAKIGMAIRLNRRRQVEGECCIDNNLMAAIPSMAVSSRFLLRYLETIDFMPMANATTVPSLRKSTLEQIAFRLPPLAEQHRIVTAVERILEKVTSARERLERVPTTMKWFRQAVLAAACSGRLTAEWRKSSATIENAASTLERLHQGRRADWERRESAKHARRNGKADSHDWKQRYKAPAQPSVPDGIDLPERWEWATVSDAARLDVGFAFRSSEFAEKGFRLLRGENLEPGFLRWRDVKYWPEDKLSGIEHLLIESGEIILALDRPVISRGLKIARAKPSDLPCLLVQRMMRFKLFDKGLTDYLYFCLQTKQFIDSLHDSTTGSDIPHITGTGIAEFTFPLPPDREREEIVRRVSAFLTLADSIEQRARTALRRVDALVGAVLAKAFRGELVPTETELARRENRSYEPASELLARLGTGANGMPKTRRGRKFTEEKTIESGKKAQNLPK